MPLNTLWRLLYLHTLIFEEANNELKRLRTPVLKKDVIQASRIWWSELLTVNLECNNCVFKNKIHIIYCRRMSLTPTNKQDSYKWWERETEIERAYREREIGRERETDRDIEKGTERERETDAKLCFFKRGCNISSKDNLGWFSSMTQLFLFQQLFNASLVSNDFEFNITFFICCAYLFLHFFNFNKYAKKCSEKRALSIFCQSYVNIFFKW